MKLILFPEQNCCNSMNVVHFVISDEMFALLYLCNVCFPRFLNYPCLLMQDHFSLTRSGMTRVRKKFKLRLTKI